MPCWSSCRSTRSLPRRRRFSTASPGTIRGQSRAIVYNFELAELICRDALDRNESCGGHFREEYQTPEGEAARDDEHYAYAAAWEFQGVGQPPVLHKEPLTFEYVHPSQRSYK
jgi:succinate dehydrogenase/fumarate reductase flavoprotein subunit